MAKQTKDLQSRKEWLRNHHKLWKMSRGLEVPDEDLEADLNFLDDTEPAI